MTGTMWVTRVLSALLALALLLGSLLAVWEIALAAMDRAHALVPHSEWARWLRAHEWNDTVVRATLVGVVVLGLLLVFLAIRRGKPASLALKAHTEAVTVTASRRSVEKSLAAAAARTTGITHASASVTRRAARINARTVAVSDSGVREELESAVKGRLDSLDVDRPLRTRVALTTRHTR